MNQVRTQDKRRHGYILSGIVLDKYRGMGVMHSLYEKGEEWLKARGIDYAEMDIHVSNPESRAFAERHGFKKYREFFRKGPI